VSLKRRKKAVSTIFFVKSVPYQLKTWGTINVFETQAVTPWTRHYKYWKLCS